MRYKQSWRCLSHISGFIWIIAALESSAVSVYASRDYKNTFIYLYFQRYLDASAARRRTISKEKRETKKCDVTHMRCIFFAQFLEITGEVPRLVDSWAPAWSHVDFQIAFTVHRIASRIWKGAPLSEYIPIKKSELRYTRVTSWPLIHPPPDGIVDSFYFWLCLSSTQKKQERKKEKDTFVF